MNLPTRSASELAAALRTRASCITGEGWEAPATADMMREAADHLDAPGRRIVLERSDLAALVASLAHEHFSYNGIGAAALRAYWKLQEAVEHDATAITLTDETTKAEDRQP